MIRQSISSKTSNLFKPRLTYFTSSQQSCMQRMRISTQAKAIEELEAKDKINPKNFSKEEPKVKQKTQAELDRELELKMAGLAGDGGEAGLELEDGKAVSMKRSVRENMFRYI